MNAIYRYSLGVSSCVIFFLAWQFVSGYALVNPILLPPPTKVLPYLWTLLTSGRIVPPLLQTFSLVLGAYCLGCALAIGVGIAMGLSKRVFLLLEPTLELVRPLPMVALIPPLFIFIGVGSSTKIVVVTLASFFPVLINTIQGVRGVDPIALGTARTFGCSRWATIRKIVFWAALPMILIGMRVALGYAIIVGILAEMLIDSSGVGFLILDMQRSFATTAMMAWIIVLGVVGFGLNAIFQLLERILVPWRSK
jgi:ABC-type nitrate/sulfonate/bicarbonate transport system permease component